MFAALVAVALLVGGALAPTPAARAVPGAATRPAAAPGFFPAATSPDGRLSLTVTSSAGSGTLPTTGSTVTFTYTVRNLSGQPAYYGSLTDSACSTPTYRTGSGMSNDGTQWWSPAGGSATFTCGTLVTQDLTSRATAVFDTSPDAATAWTPSTATATTTVTVADDPCTTMYYISNTFNSAVGTIGTVATSGTSALTPQYRVGALGNGTAFPNSSAIAVDPTSPTRAYYIPHGAGGYGGLWQLNVTTGASQRVTAQQAATSSVRLAVARDGTVWSWAIDGNLYSLAAGSTTWVRRTLTSATDVNGNSLATTQFASGDLTVGGNGNLWMLGANGTTGITYLLTVPAAETTKTAMAAVVVGRMNQPPARSGVHYNGIAFAADGTMYASSGPNTVTGPTTATNAISRVDMNTGASTTVATSPANTVGSVGDLGSCALPRAELRVLKTASSATPSITGGDVITYTIRVANLGRLSSVGATLSEAIPDNTAYVPNSTTLNGAAVADPAAGVMPYSVAGGREVHGPGAYDGVVPGRGEAVVTFRVRVTDPLPAGVTQIANQAVATDTNGSVRSDDPGLPGDADPTVVPVARAGVSLAKTASSATVAGSAQVTYTFVVSNTGNEPLAGVRVSDAMTSDRTGSAQPFDSPACASPTLQPGSDVNGNGLLDPLEPWTYRCTQPVAWTAGDPDPWRLTDAARVQAVGSVSGATVDDDASATVAVRPRPATIEVSKSAGAVVGPDSDTGLLRATYTVSVRNSGQVAGSYGPLTDTPGFADGLAVRGATFRGPDDTADRTWDGTGGSFTLAQGPVPIAAGAVHDYRVTVLFVWTSTQVPAACADNPTPGRGLFNTAGLPAGQEADPSDKGACLDPPAPPAPAIAIDKQAGRLVDAEADGAARWATRSPTASSSPTPAAR